jgi:hypothetical protein
VERQRSFKDRKKQPLSGSAKAAAGSSAFAKRPRRRAARSASKHRAQGSITRARDTPSRFTTK